MAMANEFCLVLSMSFAVAAFGESVLDGANDCSCGGCIYVQVGRKRKKKKKEGRYHIVKTLLPRGREGEGGRISLHPHQERDFCVTKNSSDHK